MKIKRSDLSIERLLSGGWIVSAVIDGHYRYIRYFGYSENEAIRLFQEEYEVKQ